VNESMLSVVVPVYCCKDCLRALCERLEETLSAHFERFEIILVDDRSPDDSWSEILSLQTQHSTVRGIRLSRNFGQQIAITAGLENARGDLVVVMDCDLQDPPELIPGLYNKLMEGYDLVLARRIDRSHSKFRVFAGQLYFRLISKLTGEPIDSRYGAFSILTRKVVDAFLTFDDKERHYLFILRWLGFEAGSIDYEHQLRHAGDSSYSLSQLIRHSLDGLLFQATVLLRWIVFVGLLSAVSGGFLAVFLVWRYLALGSLPGWTSLAVLILLATGVILICLGIIGLYIGKIFDQAKQRPLYVVDALSEGGAEGGIAHEL
jgi:glycosyltransferase involved in cell wall biosynthesis